MASFMRLARAGLVSISRAISWMRWRLPWLRVEGLNSGRCVNDGQRGYFSVRTNVDPKDQRTDRIGGEVGIAGLFIPGWGMHLADMSLVQGDLIRLVGEIGATRR
jgi:hypothetical protein